MPRYGSLGSRSVTLIATAGTVSDIRICIIVVTRGRHQHLQAPTSGDGNDETLLPKFLPSLSLLILGGRHINIVADERE